MHNLLEAVSSIQLCAGQDAGFDHEVAIRTMNSVLFDVVRVAVNFVDATNAFNSLNKKVTLINFEAALPAMSNFLINTYNSNSCL